MLMQWLLWMARRPWPQRLQCRTSQGGLNWRLRLCQRSSKQDLADAVGGALQHATIMWYMLEADQTEQGVTGETWDAQEESLLRGIPLWVLDSNRVQEGHQKVHAAEAVQEQIVTEAPVDDGQSTAPAPTLPKLKETAQTVPDRGTAAGEGTPSSNLVHANCTPFTNRRTQKTQARKTILFGHLQHT